MISLPLLALAWAGIAYTLAAAILAGRRTPAPRAVGEAPGVTILKPLHGPEPLLADKLGSFLGQDYRGRVEMVCGVSDPADPAAAVARGLAGPVRVVADRRRHGANGKVSNLVNMAERATGDVLILSDDDMAAPPGWLAEMVAALAEPGVGAVTCLYAGRGDAGFWSRVAAAGITWQFLPGVLVGLATGLATPCMGSAIAIRRETLERVGGFARFADQLADDYLLGEAVRALGLRVAVPPAVMTHGCSEPSLAALVRHELRWNVTLRTLAPLGYLGSGVTFPLPWALLALAAGAGYGTALAALAARLLLAFACDRRAGRRTLPLALVPLRDLLGFGLFVAAWFRRDVDWRGARLNLANNGRIAPVETRS